MLFVPKTEDKAPLRNKHSITLELNHKGHLNEEDYCGWTERCRAFIQNRIQHCTFEVTLSWAYEQGGQGTLFPTFKEWG